MRRPLKLSSYKIKVKAEALTSNVWLSTRNVMLYGTGVGSTMAVGRVSTNSSE